MGDEGLGDPVPEEREEKSCDFQGPRGRVKEPRDLRVGWGPKRMGEDFLTLEIGQGKRLRPERQGWSIKFKDNKPFIKCS